MKNHISIFILGLIVCLSVFLTVVQFRIPSPPAFNADEAAFSYNAYSLLKTGRDEYGTLLPLRLKSFGDFKMPLLSYLSVPFIAVFGLNEFGARSVNIVLSALFPIIVYYLTLELFGRKKYAFLAAFLSATSLGLHIVARHTHEAYLAALLTSSAFLFLIRHLKQPTLKSGIFFGISLLLMLFSYHPGRLFAGLFFGASLLYLMQAKVKINGKSAQILFIIGAVVLLFGVTDIVYKPERLKNLLFFSNPGIQLKVNELNTEGGIRPLYHPFIIGLRDIVLEHLNYFSPQFLIQNGDSNDRFGYKGMGLITATEYILFFVGLYFIFKKKEKWRYVLLFILFFSPLSASLSWSTSSLTRNVFFLVPVSMLAAYGVFNMLSEIKTKGYRIATVSILCGSFVFFLIFQWDFYLLHYPKRLITIHAWQSGYREVGEYIKKNYDRFDTFYITKDVGMPYIFVLFYLQYPPEQYQKEAKLSSPDEYGFGQVEKFDKFVFTYIDPDKAPYKSAIIGSRDQVKDVSTRYPVTMVSPQGEPMFGIIEK